MRMEGERILKFSLLMLMITVFLGSIPGKAEAQNEVVAIVININGSLEFRADNQSAWKQAKKKEPLYDGYQLRTDTGSKAVIHYASSGSRVLINENTELEIQAQRTSRGARASSERTKLIIGEIYSKVTAGSKYDVETPTSVASVRGTEFNSLFDGDEATFLVVDSVVEVMNQLGSILLSQLQAISVAEGDTPSEDDIKELSKGEVNDLISWTEGVDASWKLNIVPEGGDTHEMGAAFGLTIWAQDPETGGIDANATFALSSFEVSNDIIEFSTDNGKTWTQSPQVTLVNGQAQLQARPTADGSVDITARAEDAEPAAVIITVSKVKEILTIELKFTDPDGSGERTLILELEEK